MIPKRFRKSRVRTPTVLQMEAVECGAASLAIILGYHGRFVPLEQLRVDCGVTRDGSDAGCILQAARRYGLIARGFRKSLEKLKLTPLPVIVFWKFNHFLVVEGFGEKYVHLNDPATGPRAVTWEEFDKAFSGVTLVLQPGPDFQPGGEKPNPLNALSGRLRGMRAQLGALLVFSLFLVVPGLAVPFFLRSFVDDVLVRQTTQSPLPTAAGMALAVFFRLVLTWKQQDRLLRMETELSISMTSSFLRHVLRLPVVFFLQRHAGEIGSRVKINERVAALLSRELATNMLNGLMVVFFAAVMAWYSPLLTLVSVLFAGLNLAALHAVSRMRVDAGRKLLQERGKLVGVSMAGLRLIETYRAMGNESDFFGQWAGYHARLLNAEQQEGLPGAILSITPSLLSSLNLVAVVVIGCGSVQAGRMSPGELAAFVSLLFSFSEPIGRLVALGAELQEVEGGLTRLDDVMNYPVGGGAAARKPDGDGLMSLTQLKLSGEVELRNVTFGYSKTDPPLVRDFNLTIRPGQRVALVGSTGCGKSTIARLVCGLYEPWEGEILFDGKRREDISSLLLHYSISLVDQEIFLFEGSVRENLTLWDPTVPESHIIRAAKDACIHSDISRRRHGYLSRVEEGGRNFSGGQRQRIEIARGLVNNPTIMVLDEATSALDPATELAIDINLRRRGCSCLVVAHRLSTIRDCDEIIVLDRGSVLQRGRHEDLARVEGPYAALIRDDFKG